MRVRLLIGAVCVLTLATPATAAVAAPVALMQPSAPDPATNPTGPTTGLASPPSAVPRQQRDEVLGSGWAASTDRAWTTSGDADGLHVLVADASHGYQWQNLVTLAEPGLETDQWIGNMCVTGSGRNAVVVYAPRTFTNESRLYDRGGFSAIVDMRTGTVVKLPVLSSLAYFNPGCGAGEEAVLTQAGDEDLGRTRLVRVDTTAHRVGAKVEVAGQLTSAVPTKVGIVAADRGALVRVDGDGVRHRLVPATGVPFKVAPDADGGVVFMERTGTDKAAVRRATLPATRQKGALAPAAVQTLATGPLTSLDVTSGRGGRVFVTGAKVTGEQRTDAPSVSLVAAPAGSRLSMQGGLAVTSVLKDKPDPRRVPAGEVAVQPVKIAATVLGTGHQASFTVTPGGSVLGALGSALSPAVSSLGSAGAGSKAGPERADSPSAALADPHDPVGDADRYCAVPRNDPANQAMQPKPRQVEWAVDQAVRDDLYVYRPANWKNLQMPAYTPQGLFPPHDLVGGGYVPAQVMLGIAAQESNLWQAARFAVPGVTANPLIGNYFGLDIYDDDESDDWSINWADADCGYGVTQVTDHMRRAGREKGPGDKAWDYQVQRAVALDFAVNIAAGLQILQDKWNQLSSAEMVINNGDPSKIENWFFAVWAYNSGFHPNGGLGAPWGVGWANNPINPRYPANRYPFLEFTYQDAAHPQDWPYPEKVMGWAGHPVEVLESPDTYVAGFRPAWWNGGDDIGPLNRAHVKPPIEQFCDASNYCEPGAQYTPDDPEVMGEPAGPCAHRNSQNRYDLQCWYHEPSTWKNDCDLTCGNELLRFDPGYEYQPDGTAYQPRCTLDGLPANALIVDDVPDGTPSVRPGCGRPWTNAGTFTFTFQPDGRGDYAGKIDTHQIGGGFGGHFWFTHTRTVGAEAGRLKVTATWRLNTTHTGPMQILVALPDHGAQTNYATYVVKTASGNRSRTLRQPGEGNRWVSLGAFMFDGLPEVSLSSVTDDGDGTQDIAFDAIAFVAIAGTYREESLEAVAEFDEDQNLDTPLPTEIAGPLANRQSLYDWGMSITGDLLELPECPPDTEPEIITQCLPPSMLEYAQTWRDEIVTAGLDPVNHPDGHSMGRWIGFSQPYTDRPGTSLRPSFFDDDDHFKIRTKATISFVVAPDGKVVAGSEFASYEHRTGNTHLPEFVMELFAAVEQAYGITRPDLTYRIQDLNVHNGAWTTARPQLNGVLPGRAYAYAGKAPVPVDANSAPSQTNAVCVAGITVAGGSIGYRPMLGVDGPTQAMEDWSFELLITAGVAPAVRRLAQDVQQMFFNTGIVPGVDASILTQAPPIWQELNFKACADGTIQTNNRPLLRSSWMPNQYLYRNGEAINLDGAYSNSNQPVFTGDFGKFSAMPDPNQEFPLWPNGYGPCDAATDRSGNPWDISAIAIPPQGAGYNPDHAHFCVDKDAAIDPSHSS